MSNETVKQQTKLERREILKLLGLGTIAAAAGSMLSDAALATPDDASKLLAKLGGTSSYKSGKIKIKLPTIAENGATVPLTVSVDSPMTAGNYVKAIHIASEKNPRPEVASFFLSPASGKAEVSTRIRLGKTQNVVAVAVMNDGTVHRASQPIKVTIGGCGG
ncbi:MAG: thiosulfate oxidation carrier protein SoxY [Pseudomonadota bacterium]|nr:thiosulfate oxidation carrier protein SoxY [Pseudomonadota bacterium]